MRLATPIKLKGEINKMRKVILSVVILVAVASLALIDNRQEPEPVRFTQQTATTNAIVAMMEGVAPTGKCQETLPGSTNPGECDTIRSICKTLKDQLYLLCINIPGNTKTSCAIQLSGYYQECLINNGCL